MLIERDDPLFRTKVLALINPKVASDYGLMVNSNDVRDLCPDLYEQHFAAYDEGARIYEQARRRTCLDSPVLSCDDTLVNSTATAMRTAIDSAGWVALGTDSRTASKPCVTPAGASEDASGRCAGFLSADSTKEFSSPSQGLASPRGTSARPTARSGDMRMFLVDVHAVRGVYDWYWRIRLLHFAREVQQGRALLYLCNGYKDTQTGLFIGLLWFPIKFWRRR